VRVALCAVAVGLLSAGCGGGTTGVGQTPGTTSAPPTTTNAGAGTTTNGQPLSLALYFLAPDGQLVATSRPVEHTQTPGAATLHELVTPPGGMTTHVPDGLQLTIADGKAHVTGSALDDAALAQIVYSLTTFPTVQSVNGKTRADVEKIVPPILVEQPSPGESVTSPLDVTGTANTYEATFNYQLEDAAGKVLAKDFVTATSGSGTRGTFDFTVPFTVDTAQDGKLSVFEVSAEDGSVIHKRVIPLRLVP
jgi:immunoglobulin-like protein involved in spore germination/sporulation and spore germination protein